MGQINKAYRYAHLVDSIDRVHFGILNILIIVM